MKTSFLCCTTAKNFINPCQSRTRKRVIEPHILYIPEPLISINKNQSNNDAPTMRNTCIISHNKTTESSARVNL